MLIYTDLKDKNNKMIFSNSILVVDTENSREIGNVYFSNGSFMWRTKILSTVNATSMVITEQKNTSTMGWFDELDKYKISNCPTKLITAFPEDCLRIKETFETLGKTLTLEDAQDVWIEYSESLLAGWLYLPKDTTELEDILKEYL